MTAEVSECPPIPQVGEKLQSRFRVPHVAVQVRRTILLAVTVEAEFIRSSILLPDVAGIAQVARNSHFLNIHKPTEPSRLLPSKTF